MSKITNWRDQIRETHGDNEHSAKFIERVEHYIGNYNKAKNKNTSRDPLGSLDLLERLENDAIRFEKTIKRVTPEHRMILSRGQSYESAEEYVNFFELMTVLQNNLEEWTAQLAPIRANLEGQPIRGQVRETKHSARNAFIGATCLTYETIFDEPATFENKAFNKFLKLLTDELSIPNRKMRRLYESAYPPEDRDKNPLEILKF
jgi:hypothetical protein